MPKSNHPRRSRPSECWPSRLGTSQDGRAEQPDVRQRPADLRARDSRVRCLVLLGAASPQVSDASAGAGSIPVRLASLEWILCDAAVAFVGTTRPRDPQFLVRQRTRRPPWRREDHSGARDRPEPARTGGGRQPRPWLGNSAIPLLLAHQSAGETRPNGRGHAQRHRHVRRRFVSTGGRRHDAASPGPPDTAGNIREPQRAQGAFAACRAWASPSGVFPSSPALSTSPAPARTGAEQGKPMKLGCGCGPDGLLPSRPSLDRELSDKATVCEQWNHRAPTSSREAAALLKPFHEVGSSRRDRQTDDTRHNRPNGCARLGVAAQPGKQMRRWLRLWSRTHAP